MTITLPARDRYLAFSLLLLLLVAGAAQSGQGALSQQGLDSIQAMMDEAVASGRIPSAIALLARDDRVLWTGTAGDMGPGIPMREDAILPLASVGKMYTAVAAMILVERGVIALDDPVSRYLPEFADLQVAGDDGDALVPPDRPVTIFHLLTHTGGLRVDGDAFWAAWDVNMDFTTSQLARDLAQLPLSAQPGERFEYGPTGASYEVLGAVIETASGQTLEDFMFDNIFEPLGLQDSYFYVPDAKSDRLPACYRMVDRELQLDRAYGEDFPRTTFFHGGGGVAASAADVARFARLFLDGGTVDGVRILSPESIALMMRDQVGERSTLSRGLGWGFGAAVRQAPSGETLYYGWVGGGYAILWVEPATRLIAYFAFPLTPPGDNDLLREFERRVEQATSDNRYNCQSGPSSMAMTSWRASSKRSASAARAAATRGSA